MEDGGWRREDGGWRMEDGGWRMEDGGWRMEDGGWRMEDGGWRMEDGGWRMEDGGWRMEDGGWRMEDGGWRMEDGGWRPVGFFLSGRSGSFYPLSSILYALFSILYPPSSILFFLSSFIRRSNHDEAAVRPGHGAAHQNDVVFAIDTDDAEVAHRDPAGTITARHALAFFRPAATAVAGNGTDTAGGPVMALDTVTGSQPLEAVPLHHAGRAPALASADYVDGGHAVEYFHGRQDLANLSLRGRIQTEFADVTLWLAVGLGRQGYSGGSARPAAVRFQLRRDMTTLRLGCLAARLVKKAELHSIIAVALLFANKQHRTRAGLQHGDRGQLARFVVNLCHPNF